MLWTRLSASSLEGSRDRAYPAFARRLGRVLDAVGDPLAATEPPSTSLARWAGLLDCRWLAVFHVRPSRAAKSGPTGRESLAQG